MVIVSIISKLLLEIDKIVEKTQLALFLLKMSTLNTLMFLIELYKFKF